jgi:hypothetical protein
MQQDGETEIKGLAAQMVRAPATPLAKTLADKLREAREDNQLNPFWHTLGMKRKDFEDFKTADPRAIEKLAEACNAVAAAQAHTAVTDGDREGEARMKAETLEAAYRRAANALNVPQKAQNAAKKDETDLAEMLVRLRTGGGDIKRYIKTIHWNMKPGRDLVEVVETQVAKADLRPAAPVDEDDPIAALKRVSKMRNQDEKSSSDHSDHNDDPY